MGRFMFHCVPHIVRDIKSESSFCNVMACIVREGVKKSDKLHTFFSLVELYSFSEIHRLSMSNGYIDGA